MDLILFGKEAARVFAEMAEGSPRDASHRKALRAELSQDSESDTGNLFTG